MKDVSLVVTDVDNTLFDWVNYYTKCFWGLLEVVESLTDIPIATLAEESKAVFEKYGSIEYPFLVQELPSIAEKYGDDIDYMLDQIMEPARKRFLDLSTETLVPYAGVDQALKEIKKRYPKAPIVALTDAHRYVAMWKMNKLGLLGDFDAVYGLKDPQIPTCERNRRVKVKPGILLKHLQQYNFGYQGRIRILPDDYEKPGTKGLRTVLMDFEMDGPQYDRNQVIWVGDNQRKDIPLGKSLGVKTFWAEYGAKIPKDMLARLSLFSPPLNVHKNANIERGGENFMEADHTLYQFSDILRFI